MASGNRAAYEQLARVRVQQGLQIHDCNVVNTWLFLSRGSQDMQLIHRDRIANGTASKKTKDVSVFFDDDVFGTANIFISIINLAVSSTHVHRWRPSSKTVMTCSKTLGQAGEKITRKIKTMHSAVEQSHLVYLLGWL